MLKMNKELSDIRLIMGLGNPSEQYEYTYHNVGTLFIGHLLECFLSKQGNKRTFAKPTASNNFEYLKMGHFIFVRPLLFMNESGAAIRKASAFFGIKPDELLVIHDDSDIETGKYKISFGRGAGGHRGIESIIQTLKTKNFWRLRIGIRPKVSNIKHQVSRKKASEFVLKKINSADKKILYSAFEDIERMLFTGSTSAKNLS